jgi:hypothetical protein
MIDVLNAHLKQWQEVSGYLLKQQEALRSIQKMINAKNSMGKSLEPILAAQANMQKMIESIQIPRYQIPDISYLTKQITSIIDFQGSIQETISSVFGELQRSFRELPPRTQEALLILGAHGWYFDLDLPLPKLWNLKKALSEGDAQEAEQALIEYFEGRINKIEESILKRYPKRDKLIRAAFNAHRKQQYELAIPVMFAQTDGICKDIANQYLFIKKNRKPGTAIYAEQIAVNSFKGALLSPLAQTLPIGMSQHERSGDFNELNRHMVMHGESLDYGTKTNSLKAISLINFVAHVLAPEDEASDTALSP